MIARLIAALIVLTLFACALVASRREAPLLADRHSSGQWNFNNAEAPRNPPQEHRLFATCPVTPWALPKAQGVHQT